MNDTNREAWRRRRQEDIVSLVLMAVVLAVGFLAVVALALWLGGLPL